MSEQDTLQQFRSIAGIESDADNEKIQQLLQVHDNDLNGALLVYFDSGFDTINQPSTSTTGAQIHEDDNQLHRRGHGDVDIDQSTPDYALSNRSVEFTNLQSQMYMENFLPKLPKSGKISNNWQLELGIYASIHDNSTNPNNGNKSHQTVSNVKKPWSLWIILLFIPKTLFHIIVSALKYLFGSSNTTTNRFPKVFDYEHYHCKLTIKDWLSTTDDDDETRVIDEKQNGEFCDENGTKGSNMVPTTSIVEEILDQFNIHDCNFNEVHDECQKGYIWLIAILVNDSVESQQWAINLFSSDRFKKLFNKTNGEFKENVIYFGNVDRSPEAHAVGQQYRVRRLPYVMLCGNVSSNPAVMASMSIVYKSNLSLNYLISSEVSSTNKKITRNLARLCDNFNPQLISSRFDKQEIEFARLMVKQQDDAYEQSLQQDREKKFVKEQEIMRQQNELKQQITKKKFLDTKLTQDYFALIKGSTRMAIKLPDGTRIVESFSTDISVNQLYLFIELKMYEKSNEENNDSCDDEQDKPEENFQVDLIQEEEYFQQFPFNFEIIQPFPKRVITAQQGQISTVDELRSGANLLVEYVDEEDDDDDQDQND
jgi:UBX domain-containing protein 2